MPGRFAQDAQLVWFDPGITTGIAVVCIDPEWLCSRIYSASWEGLGKAVRHVWHAQTGRHARDNEGLTLAEIGDDDESYELLRVLAGKGHMAGGPVEEHTLREIENAVAAQDVLDQWPSAAWGYESFEVRQINTDPDFLSPARLGLAMTLSEVRSGESARTPFTQTASHAIHTVSDERLKAAGLFKPGFRHANDAARHAATFFRGCRGPAPTAVARRQRAWPYLFGAPE